MPSFYTILTDVGQAKLANAIALGQTIDITELAVGDGNGALPVPETSRTALVNEVRRAPINLSEVDDQNPNWVVVEQVLPPDVGGWTIREVGVFDIDGDLIGYGNYPETYKPVLAEGSSRTQTVRFVMEVSDTASITLKVDPSVVLATREYVDEQRSQHEQSRNHPRATTTEQGMVEKATFTESKEGAADKFPDAAMFRNVLDYFGVSDAHSITAGDDLNDYTRPGTYIYSSGDSPVNAPIAGAGFLQVINRKDESLPIQVYFRVYQTKIFYRSRTGAQSTSPWNDWVEFFHGGNQLPLGTTRSSAFEAVKQLATTTLAGVVEKATTQECEQGAQDKYPDAAGVQKALMANPFNAKAVAEPFPIWDHLPGSTPPSNSGSAKFIKLSAGLDGVGLYNEGLLINETVSGSGPTTEITAEIATGPLAGQRVNLINSENRYLMPGEASGAIANDQMQQITGAFQGALHDGGANPMGAGAITRTDVYTILGTGTGRSVSAFGFDSANSPNARTADHTNVKNSQATYYMRIA